MSRDLSPKKRPGLKRTYTVPEAAALLRVSRVTVYAMIADGRIKSILVSTGQRVYGPSIWSVLRSAAAFSRARTKGIALG